MAYIILVGLGLILGSFCNATIWRIREQQQPPSKRKSKLKDQELSIVSGRSRCFQCGHELEPIDLIPVISFLMLRGKCRYCGKSIPDTPVAELLLPLLFVVSYQWWPLELSGTAPVSAWLIFIGWLACLVMFVILALYDLKWFLLPDRVVLPLIGVASAVVAVQAVASAAPVSILISSVWGVALSAGLFYALHLFSKGAWIGLGDVKLAVALGLLVGGPLNALLLLFVASFTGSLAAIPLLARHKPIGKTRIPFGPFLMLAAVIIMLFGTAIGSWYMNVLII